MLDLSQAKDADHKSATATVVSSIQRATARAVAEIVKGTAFPAGVAEMVMGYHQPPFVRLSVVGSSPATSFGTNFTANRATLDHDVAAGAFKRLEEINLTMSCCPTEDWGLRSVVLELDHSAAPDPPAAATARLWLYDPAVPAEDGTDLCLSLEQAVWAAAQSPDSCMDEWTRGADPKVVSQPSDETTLFPTFP